MGKKYRGQRIGVRGCKFEEMGARDERWREIDRRYDLHNHSPDGFEWGYAGSGPAQLALALCADALDDDDRALKIYQEFKFRVVAKFKGDVVWITQEDIIRNVEEIEAEYKVIRDEHKTIP